MRAVSSILLSSCFVCVNREIKLKMPECVQEPKGEHIDLQIRSNTGRPVLEQRGGFQKCMNEGASIFKAGQKVTFSYVLSHEKYILKVR